MKRTVIWLPDLEPSATFKTVQSLQMRAAALREHAAPAATTSGPRVTVALNLALCLAGYRVSRRGFNMLTVACLVLYASVGCQSDGGNHASSDGSSLLHLTISSEMDVKSFRLRVYVDGVKRIDRDYESAGVYSPATFDWALPPRAHEIRIEIPGKTACMFGVSTTQTVWASVWVGGKYGDKSKSYFATYTTSNYPPPPF